MPVPQPADSGDDEQDSGRRALVVNLARGNEVVEPDTRTVKKRKSSGGGGAGNGGHSNAFRESGEVSTSTVPVPPMHHLHLSSGRQSTGKPFELDPRKLQAKHTSATGASGVAGTSYSASDSVDSLPSSFASRVGSTSASVGRSSTVPTSLSSSPHLSSTLVNSPMRMPASEVERQLKDRPADFEKPSDRQGPIHR